MLASVFRLLSISDRDNTSRSWLRFPTSQCVLLQMSKADKARMKKDKAKSFNNAGATKSAAKNAKRWN